MTELNFVTTETETKQQSCKGLFFRASTNYYFDGIKLVEKKELRLLKRKSCAGCESCGWFNEALSMEEESIIPDDLEHGEVYELKVNSHKYWTDCGYDYDYDLYFEKLIDKESE